MAGGLLFNGDSGGQTFNVLDIGLFHQRQKLSCIGGE